MQTIATSLPRRLTSRFRLGVRRFRVTSKVPLTELGTGRPSTFHSEGPTQSQSFVICTDRAGPGRGFR